MAHINWIGVLIGLVVGQVIGMLWYAVLFQKPWLALQGIVPDKTKGAGAAMAVGALVNLITVIGLGFLIGHFSAGDLNWMNGAHAGLFVSFFFCATTVALRAVYSTDTFSARPWKLFAIDASYLVVYLTIDGAIFGLMG
jgi:hypothetical protein